MKKVNISQKGTSKHTGSGRYMYERRSVIPEQTSHLSTSWSYGAKIVPKK